MVIEVNICEKESKWCRGLALKIRLCEASGDNFNYILENRIQNGITEWLLRSKAIKPYSLLPYRTLEITIENADIFTTSKSSAFETGLASSP